MKGVEFLMIGEKMAFKIGKQQFILDYEPSEPGEFEFIKDMLVSALSVFTPDVKIKKEHEAVQVSPLQFVEMVMEKEHLIGKPIVWAQWPNEENT